MAECNTETEASGAGNYALRLDSLQAAKWPGPRFVGLPLSVADQQTLLCFAEALANLFQEMIERTAGRPVSCELVTEIHAIIAKAEFDGRVAVMNRLGEESA